MREWTKETSKNYIIYELKRSPLPYTLAHNIGATNLSTNTAFYARTKHIEIDFHFVHDKVASNTLVVHFISGKDNLTDIFTHFLSFFPHVKQAQRHVSRVSLMGGVMEQTPFTAPILTWKLNQCLYYSQGKYMTCKTTILTRNLKQWLHPAKTKKIVQL